MNKIEQAIKYLADRIDTHIEITHNDIRNNDWTAKEIDKILSEEPTKPEFEFLSFFEEGETSVGGTEMLKRAKELNACGTQEDLDYLLSHQDEIPEEMKGKYIVFTELRHPGDSESVACVFWGDGFRRWIQDWGWLDNDWNGRGRVLRRKSETRTLESRPEEIFTKENINECARKSNEEQRKVCGLETLTLQTIMEKFDEKFRPIDFCNEGSDKMIYVEETRDEIKHFIETSIREVLEEIENIELAPDEKTLKLLGELENKTEAFGFGQGWVCEKLNSNIKKVLN